MRLTLTAAAAGIMLAGCGTISIPEQSAPAFGDWGIDLSARNITARPGDDFEAYASGMWLAETEIPDDQGRQSLIDTLSDTVKIRMRDALTVDAGKDAASAGVKQKLLHMYSAWMDEARLNRLGIKPLKPALDVIYKANSHAALLPELASIYGDAPFRLGIIADPADPSRYIAYVVQSGLGMETREYYLNADPDYAAYRDAYEDYVTTLFHLAGYDEPRARAQSILSFETELAKIHWTQADSLVVEKIYNPMSIQGLQELAPDIDWASALDRRGLAAVNTILVVQPSAISGGAALFAKTPLPVVKDYLAFHLLNQCAGDLSTAFDNARHKFHDKTLRGRKGKSSRWSRGIDFLNVTMGVGLGQLYVDKYFPESSKRAVADMTATVIEAFRTRLNNNAWMDDATRREALIKLDMIEPRIAYPDRWVDYASLKTDPRRHLENKRAVMAFEWRQDLARLGGPVDRERWVYPPQTVSAYYDSQVNQITLLAGILQPPFFDPAADAAVNYGAIGAIIGHELGHGFDSTGRMFDGAGVLRDWWTNEADRAFRLRESNLIEQYDNYEPLNGLFINGALTISENIGDLGGLEIAYTAYRQYLDLCCNGEAPVIDGLTGDQRFFLAWAQIWRGKSSDDALRNQLLTNEHSPYKYRINGVVRNMDAWYDAFDVKPGDALYLLPEERVTIW